MKLLLFDIDGTLLRSEGATYRALTQTFKELFRVREMISILNLIGATDYGIFKDAANKLLGRTLTEDETRAVEERYLELLPKELAEAKFELKPGIPALLDALAARKDVILGIETGNLEAGARLKLRRGGIEQYFKTGGYGSDSESRVGLIRKGIERAGKLNGGAFAPGDIYVIGDAPHDVTAGREARAVTIAVGTGLLPQEEVLAAGPDYFINNLSDIPLFLRITGLEK